MFAGFGQMGLVEGIVEPGNDYLIDKSLITASDDEFSRNERIRSRIWS